MVKRKRLFFDIETSYMLVKTHAIGRKIFLDHKSIKVPAKIICICYRWEGGRYEYLTWDSKQNDKKMLERFIKLANHADELIAHNGDNFDIKWIRTRCMVHKIPMFPNYSSIDTLKGARKFRFPSNRLDGIGRYLGIGGKINAPEELWDKVSFGNCQKSLAKMVRYCIGDVRLLYRVFEAINPYLPAKTHYGVLYDGKKSDCPECGSSHTKKNKKTVSAQGFIKHQYQCLDCGKFHTRTDDKKTKNAGHRG